MSKNKEKQIHFKLVSDENRKEIEGLTVFSEQAGFIESVSECLQEADELELWRPVGIYDYENNPHAIKLYQQIGFQFNGKYDSKGEHIMEYAFR